MPFHGYQGRVHTAVYWPRVGTDQYGQPIVSSIAEELDVRWDDTRREIMAPGEGTVVIDATVSGMEKDIPIGSAFWKGRIEDIPGTGQVPTSDVMRVVTFSSTADIRGRNHFREATLMRAADALPSTGEGQ